MRQRHIEQIKRNLKACMDSPKEEMRIISIHGNMSTSQADYILKRVEDLALEGFSAPNHFRDKMSKWDFAVRHTNRGVAIMGSFDKKLRKVSAA